MAQVTIYHNLAQDESGRHLGWIDGYMLGHPLAPVARYHTHLSSDAVLEDAFERFNVGEDLVAKKYRNAGNRSLSVGDVVSILDGAQLTYHAVARFGWDNVSKPQWFAYASAHDTKSIID